MSIFKDKKDKKDKRSGTGPEESKIENETREETKQRLSEEKEAEIDAFLANYQGSSPPKTFPGPENGGGKPQKDQPSKKQRRRTYLLIAIVSACAVALILWLAIPQTGQSAYENNASGIVQDTLETHEGFPVSISGTSVSGGNFYVAGKQAGYVSDTSIVRLSEKGSPIYERSHSFYHPIAQVSGEYLLVYNVGGNGFRIDNQKETLRNEVLDNVIMAADVAENGRYALVTEQKGYPSHMEVFKEDGALQYRYSFSNCYVSDVSLSRDGSRAAVIGVTASEGELVSELYFFDFNSETPLTVAQFSGAMLLDVQYCGDGRVLAVGDTLLASVSADGEKTEYPYGDMQLADYDFNEDRVLLALSPYDSTSASRLLVANSRGEAVSERDCEEMMTSVSLFGDTMAALAGDKVYCYSVNAVRNFHGKEGEQQAAFHVTEASNDVKAIALADETSVYILGISQVQYEDY